MSKPKGRRPKVQERDVDPRILAQARKMAREYEDEDLGLLAIAGRHGVSKETVRQRLKLVGVTLRRGGSSRGRGRSVSDLTPDERKELRAMRRRGCSYDEIALAGGMSQYAAVLLTGGVKPRRAS